MNTRIDDSHHNWMNTKILAVSKMGDKGIGILPICVNDVFRYFTKKWSFYTSVKCRYGHYLTALNQKFFNLPLAAIFLPGPRL